MQCRAALRQSPSTNLTVVAQQACKLRDSEAANPLKDEGLVSFFKFCRHLVHRRMVDILKVIESEELAALSALPASYKKVYDLGFQQVIDGDR